jgi:hypothetical protein
MKSWSFPSPMDVKSGRHVDIWGTPAAIQVNPMIVGGFYETITSTSLKHDSQNST